LFSIFITLPSLIIRIIPLSYFVFNKTGGVKKNRSAAYASGQAGSRNAKQKAQFLLLYFYHKSMLFSNEKQCSSLPKRRPLPIGKDVMRNYLKKNRGWGIL